MPYRVTDSTINDRLVSQIATQRARLAAAQEQVATGKRINRPSDDPYGAAAVIEIHTSQAALDQLGRNANLAESQLTVADGTLDSYEHSLDRARTLISQGISGFLKPGSGQDIAIELDGLRQTILNIANLNSNGQYLSVWRHATGCASL
jgi:flagellar hook-associated protein 3 FlgL